MKNYAIELTSRCIRCPRCSCFLMTRQERKDGLCLLCGDAPAVADVNPCAIVEWAMNKARAEDAAAN